MSKVSFEDTSIFSRPCDIFSPCAQGRVRNLFLVFMPPTSEKLSSPGAYVVPVNMNVNFWQHA